MENEWTNGTPGYEPNMLMSILHPHSFLYPFPNHQAQNDETNPFSSFAK
jgi:hypothetical protein